MSPADEVDGVAVEAVELVGGAVVVVEGTGVGVGIVAALSVAGTAAFSVLDAFASAIVRNVELIESNLNCRHNTAR